MRDNLRRDWKDWEVLIQDHHEGYISWAEFERNQHLIADNANGKSYMGRGSIRRGEALLPGLFRCARCGRRLLRANDVETLNAGSLPLRAEVEISHLKR